MVLGATADDGQALNGILRSNYYVINTTHERARVGAKRVYSWGLPNEYAIFVRFLALAE